MIFLRFKNKGNLDYSYAGRSLVAKSGKKINLDFL